MIISITTIVHLFICFLIICLVLLQQGKGADMGATFGGGSNSVFGASGADSLLTKATTFIAVGFMVTSVMLAAFGKNSVVSSGSIMDDLPETVKLSDEPIAVDSPVKTTAEQNKDDSAPKELNASAVSKDDDAKLKKLAEDLKAVEKKLDSKEQASK